MTSLNGVHRILTMTISSLFILFFQSINLGVCTQVFYELKDLEVLEKEKNFEEFLLHVNDIRPSQRDQHWKEMLQSMALGLVDYKIKSQDYSPKSFKQIEQISRSSAMNGDQLFELKRARYAKKYFAECFRKAALESESPKLELDQAKTLCENQLSAFWIFSKKDPDIGLELAAILEGHQASIKLWPFYEMAIKDSISAFYCKKPSVQKAVVLKLYEETFSQNFNGNYKNLVNRIVPDNCFEEIAPALKETLTSINSNGLDKEMAFNILDAKGKLSKDEEDLYAVLFLLDGPVVGDKMNLAWRNIEALSENYPKRQKILNQLIKLPILPDKIFKDPYLPRHKAIINLFAKNFPEYLNYYGSTCIKFLTNSGSEPLNVSSSYQCNQFLKAASTHKKESGTDATLWISDSVESLYSGLKR